jgi:hypothetical protein
MVMGMQSIVQVRFSIFPFCQCACRDYAHHFFMLSKHIYWVGIFKFLLESS